MKSGVSLDAKYRLDIQREEYKGITLTHLDIGFDESLVEDRLAELLHAASFQHVEGTPAADGDIAVVDYGGSIGADAINAQGLRIELGSGDFAAPFEDGIKGHVAGDDFSLDFPMPSPHLIERWEGAPVSVHVSLLDVQRSMPYEASDDYVRSVSDFSGLDELKSVIREQFEIESSQESSRMMRSQIIEALSSLAKGKLERSILAEYATMYLCDGSDPREASEQDRQDMLDDAAFEIAWKSIALQEGIEAGDGEIDERYSQLKAYYKDSGRTKKEMRREARDLVCCEKVIGLVTSNAVAEVPQEKDV